MSTPPPRKRVSQACQPCGLKKIKCDGTYPVCSPCQSKGVECTYGVSKRSRARSSINESPRPRPQPHPSQSSHENLQSFHPINDNHSIAHHQVARAPAHKPKRHILSVSAEISTRLLQTYFNCLHPLWPILYKPLYASLDYSTPTDMMPPALVAAIFSIASCVDRPQQYATNTIVQRYPEPFQFFEEALDLIQQGKETEKPHLLNALAPSITNCQVLTILSLQQHGVAEYSRAAILCGLASAMAIEMRLHRPYESNDPIQSEVHSRLWWNLYILEKMSSTEMGRPVILRYEETDCPYPSVSEADEFELMSTQAGNQGLSGQIRNTAIKLRTLSGLHSTIRLSIIIEKISREIYGLSSRKLIRDSQASGEAKRMDLWYALKEWEREMEASPLRLDLSKDLTSVPSAITNYVIMFHATILLHRPYIARWPANPGASQATASPLDVCLDAAKNICLVLEKYFDRLLGLPCDMVFSVFTAASTLLYHSKNSKGDDVDTQRNLKLCIHWLSVLGKSWKSAGARHQLLADMFDLPQELRDQGPGNPPSLRADTPLTQNNSNQGYMSPHPRIAGNGILSPGQMKSPEDWSFLRDFGDETDDFYELDVQLRGLLDGKFEPETAGFVG